MTDEELKEIEERWEKANEVLNGVGVYDNNWTKSHRGMLALAVQDIPALIAELKAERDHQIMLNAEIDGLRSECEYLIDKRNEDQNILAETQRPFDIDRHIEMITAYNRLKYSYGELARRCEALERAIKRLAPPCLSCKHTCTNSRVIVCGVKGFPDWQFDEERIGKDGDGA